MEVWRPRCSESSMVDWLHLPQTASSLCLCLRLSKVRAQVCPMEPRNYGVTSGTIGGENE